MYLYNVVIFQGEWSHGSELFEVGVTCYKYVPILNCFSFLLATSEEFSNEMHR